MNLQVDIFSQTAAPNTILTVTLPAEIELINGSLNWSGDIVAKQSVGIDLTIRVKQAGEWFVFAQAFSYTKPGTIYGFGGDEGVYLRSSANLGEVIRGERITTPPPLVQYDPSLWTPTPTLRNMPTQTPTSAPY